MILTVLTPTYNRASTLPALYNSLLAQTCMDFVWLIVDDGSSDNTSDLIHRWQSCDNRFKISYIQKENGGKHTALNEGFIQVTTELTFIVDSDDILTPDAVATIVEQWKNINAPNLAGIAFLRGYSKNRIIGKRFLSEGKYNDIDMRIRKNIYGDKAEVWRTDILRKYQFPVFENEKFQGENYVWWQIALEYDMYYINKIIYITEYLEGGLTQSGRNLRIRCPLGGMENSKIGLHPRFPLRERCKRAWLYVCYGKFAGKSKKEIISQSGYPLLIRLNYLCGYLLYSYWKTKYQ